MSKIFNNALFEAKERESAVSPVVGVMLMLVVTIIIAATVSAFAGGLVGSADKTPQAAFDVKIVKGGAGPSMSIAHLGGDAIDTARMKIIATWTNKTSQAVNYRETTALPFNATPQNNGYINVNLTLDYADVCNTYGSYHEPYLVIPDEWPGYDASLWFGNFILHPGEVMKVDSSLKNDAFNNLLHYDDYSVIKNSMQLTSKDSVNVKLIDIPTGNILFEKDVYVVEG